MSTSARKAEARALRRGEVVLDPPAAGDAAGEAGAAPANPTAEARSRSVPPVDVRSERDAVPCPAVIRLVRYVHVPRRFRRQVTNTFLFARDEYTCQYCDRHRSALGYRESLTRDHVVPISRGGGNGWRNVVTACSRCNLEKGDRLPEEAGMHLSKTPREPNHVELIWAVRKVTPIQAKYIAMFYGEEVVEALRH